MKDIFEKEFRSKLKVENEKIYTYIENNKLQMEKIMETYNNYISTIIRNSHINLSNEDVEEVILDVFLTLWKNQNKLDINKSMSAYISGITKNLIKYKYRQCKITQNIKEYEEKLIDNSNIEITLLQNEKQKIISEELEKIKQEDKEIFIEYYYDDKNIKEISKKFNMTESKVKSKLFRVRKRLNKILKKRGYSSNEQ
jgi:RNA polymerase sigma factor, sigma-70 family